MISRSLRRVVGKLARSARSFLAPPIDDSKFKPQWQTVASGQCCGIKLFISNVYDNMANGSYDVFLYDALKETKVDLTDAVVWDVGAHLGYHTLSLAKLVGSQGRVVAFEPNPYNEQRLTQNLQANPEISMRVQIKRTALSDKDGVHSMRISTEIDNATSSGSYIDFGRPPSDRHSKTIYDRFQSMDVQVTKADTIVRETNLIPKFVKVDIEAAEVNFLLGAHDLLEIHRPLLTIEVHNIQSMFHVSEILYAHGYHLQLIDDGVNASSRCFVLAFPSSENRQFQGK